MTDAADSTSGLSPAQLGLGIAGAIGGAVVGYFGFKFALQSGFYALAFPGALLGAGCAIGSRTYSKPLGIMCAIGAAVLGILLEWHFLPFVADGSLSFFVTHLHQLNGVTLLMMLLGIIGGYWFGVGRQSN